MAIISIKSGKRGRPLTLDTSALEKKLFSDMQKATQRLEQFRKESKGVKDERILGTSTSAPDFAYETLTLLRNAQQINYRQALKLKQNLKTISELASKQRRVYERALAEQLQEQYFEDIDKVTSKLNKQTQERGQEIKSEIQKLTKRQKQQFFMSKHYQRPQNLGKYKKISDWAKADSGNANMSDDEAGIYLIQRRLQDGLGVGALTEVFDADNPFE